MKKVKIKRIKDDKRKTVKIKRTEINNGLRKVNIYNMKSFYEKYMKNIPQSPDLYINSLCMEICQAGFFKTMPDLSERHRLMKKWLRKDIVNRFYDIFANTSYGKLNHIGVVNYMYETAKTLLELLEYLKTEAGIKMEFDFTLNDLREAIYTKSFLISNNKEYIRQHRAMILDNDRVISEFREPIRPNRLWKGTRVLLEYNNNMWVSIPYNYYKRLYNLKKVRMYASLTIADNDEEFYTIDKTLYTVQDIIEFMLNYRNMWSGLNIVNDSGWMNIWEEKVKVTVYKANGKVEEMDHYHFFSYYCEFLGV